MNTYPVYVDDCIDHDLQKYFHAKPDEEVVFEELKYGIDQPQKLASFLDLDTVKAYCCYESN